MPDIFLSYAASDRALASAVVASLEVQKWSVFWDRRILGGKKWLDVLQQELEDAKCVLVLLTRQSLDSEWVTYEASVAIQKRILVPLLLEPDLNPNRDLPEMYRGLHVISMAPDEDDIRTVGQREPWIKAIRALVEQGRRKRRLSFAAMTLILAITSITAAYVYATGHNALVDWQSGLRHAERGPYSKDETERLKSAIRHATSIDLMVVNANSFAANLREDLAVFFGAPGHQMRVLFANPDTDFYKEMMEMTTPGIGKDPKAMEADRGKFFFSRRAILATAGSAGQAVQFRQFNTQFRLPIIVIDKKYCFITLRLSPDQAQESLRFELSSEMAGTGLEQSVSSTLRRLSLLLLPSTQDKQNVESCVRHFDTVWEGSKPITVSPS